MEHTTYGNWVRVQCPCGQRVDIDIRSVPRKQDLEAELIFFEGWKPISSFVLCPTCAAKAEKPISPARMAWAAEHANHRPDTMRRGWIAYRVHTQNDKRAIPDSEGCHVFDSPYAAKAAAVLNWYLRPAEVEWTQTPSAEVIGQSVYYHTPDDTDELYYMVEPVILDSQREVWPDDTFEESAE